jgi:LysR family glycine cleavage system transcriptional activator
MPSLRADVGSLTPLFAFEAAGRLGSFTRAARELGVTQVAVSKQIANLEGGVGLPLFQRLHRRVELYAVTSAALHSVAAVMRDMKAKDGGMLTIAMSIDMSRFWFMPILPEFTSAHPEIQIRVISQDDQSRFPDNADICVTFESSAPTGNALPLFGGSVRAMASPAFLRRRRLRTPSDVAMTSLIAYDAPSPSWVTWKDWAIAAGIAKRPASPVLSLSRYQDALAAAHRGQGVVLVWSVCGQTMDEQGLLIAVPGPVVSASGLFYVTLPQPARKEALSAREWLLSKARPEPA